MAQNACCNTSKTPPVKDDSDSQLDITCSCEDCTEATCLYCTKILGGLSNKKSDACCEQSNPPGNDPDTNGFLGRNFYQFYNKIVPTTCSTISPEAKQIQQCVLEKCTCIGDQTYEVMTETLRQQESIVGLQKRAYLPKNYLSQSKTKKECRLEKYSYMIGDQNSGLMEKTLRQQESIVGIQKGAYLPKNDSSENQTYGVMAKTQRQQESIVGIQKSAYLPKNDSLENQTYEVMAKTQRQQELIVGNQKRAYLPKNYSSESKTKIECTLEKYSYIGDQTYGVIAKTLRQQESIVGIQKKAYLPKYYSSENQTYGVIAKTLRQQESIVGIQKRAYLQKKYSPESKTKKECILEKCSCIQNQTYKVMIATLHKQESIIETQKKAYLPKKYLSKLQPKKECILEKCSCVGDQTYGIMTAILQQQQSIAEIQNRGIVLINYLSESEPKKKCIVEKCSCIGDQTYGVMKATLRQQESIVDIQKKAYLSKKEALLGDCICMMQPDSFYTEQRKDTPKLPDYFNGSAVYVYDAPKICCDNQEPSAVPKSCHKQESPNLIEGEVGYVFDIPKTCYDKQEPPTLMEYKVGYVFDIPKTSYDKRETPDLMNGEAGYVFDIPKTCYDKQETPDLMKSKAGYVFDVPKTCYKKQESPDLMEYKVGYVFDIPKTCYNKQETPDLMKGKAGYIFDVPKTCYKKQESPDLMKGKAGYVFDVPKTCYDKQESPDLMKGKAGYVFDLSKFFCDKQESPDLLKNASGYVFELPKIYKDQRQCSRENKIKKYRKMSYECSMCSALEKSASSSVTKTARPLLERDTQVYNLNKFGSNTMHNCGKTKNTLDGYVYELPTYKSTIRTKTCVCRKSDKNKSAPQNFSGSSRCVTQLQTCKTSHESADKISINKFKVKGIASDSKNILVKKKSCEVPLCTDISWVVPKHSAKHDHEKKKCGCKESTRFKSDKPVSYLEQKRKINSSMFTEPGEHKHKLPECAYDIPICREIDNTERVWKNKKSENESYGCPCADELPKFTHKVPSQKSSCVCRDTTKIKPVAQELTKCIQSDTQTVCCKSIAVQMPEAEFKDCLTCRQSNMANIQRKITTSDILKRLKEAYKACSCKICDCFSNNKTNACKPHECGEMSRSISSFRMNEQPLCFCKPCDCVQCTKNVGAYCDCNPCNCANSKTRSITKGQSFFVAPVVIEKNTPRLACTCAPCACIECGIVYPLASSVVNEMSTSINRPALCRCEICLNESCDQSGLDSCRCQKPKVMSKPVEHDTHDFDIRTASIVTNTQLFPSNKAKAKSDFDDRYNYYAIKMPYEYHLYEKKQSHDTSCDRNLISCETTNEPENQRRFGRHSNSDDPFEQSFKKETLGKVLPLRKGDILTPSTHLLKLKKLILQKQHLEEPSCSILKLTTNKDASSKLGDDADIFSELTSEFNTSNRKTGSITQANINMSNFSTKYIRKSKTFTYDSYMQQRNKKAVYKNIVIEKETGSCISDHSSSYDKRYGSNTLNLPNKSRESSCYNLPEYFIKSPKGTTETSLKEDESKLDTEETIEIDNCDIVHNSTKQPNEDKECDNMTVPQ